MSSDNKRHSSVNCELDAEEPPRKIRRYETSGSSNVFLAELLDFSALSSEVDIGIRFEQLADALLCNYNLILEREDTQTEFEVLELEFYLQKFGVHEDPFTHGSDEQRYSGRWCVSINIRNCHLTYLTLDFRYFHRAPTRLSTSQKGPSAAGGYRGGTRKGLDLTIGGPVTSPHFPMPTMDTASSLLRGGILLRALRRSSDGSVILGPSLLVDEILRLSGARSISDLVENIWGGKTAALAPESGSSICLYLQRRQTNNATPKPTIYHSSRVGLDLSHPSTTPSLADLRVIYISKLYRCFVHPHLLTSNGRGHTFISVYRTCIDSQRFTSDEDVLQEVIKLLNMKERTALRYLAAFNAGSDKGTLRSFVGPAGKGTSASPGAYLKMMGTLARMDRKMTAEAPLNATLANDGKRIYCSTRNDSF